MTKQEAWTELARWWAPENLHEDLLMSYVTINRHDDLIMCYITPAGERFAGLCECVVHLAKSGMVSVETADEMQDEINRLTPPETAGRYRWPNTRAGAEDRRQFCLWRAQFSEPRIAADA